MGDFDFCAVFARRPPGFRNYRCIGFVSRGCRDAEVNSQSRAYCQQRVAHVIAVTDICQFEPAQISEAFLKSEKIRIRLARMAALGQRVDDGNRGVLRELSEHSVLKYARDNSLHPAVKIARHIAD